MLFSSDSLSIFVSAPLFYAFAIFGIVYLILNFIAWVGSILDFSNEVMKEYGGSWAMAMVSFFFCFIIFRYMDPIQRVQLFETPALLFILFPIFDVFVRSVFYQPSKKPREEAFLERLEYVKKSFPVGTIGVFTFFAGGHLLGILLASPSQDPEFFLVGFIVYLIIFSLPIEFLNRGIGETGLHRDELLNLSYWWQMLGRGLRSNRPYQRAWSPSLSLLSALFLTVGCYLVVSLLFQTNENGAYGCHVDVVNIQLSCTLAFLRNSRATI